MRSIAFAVMGLCLVGCGAAADADGTSNSALEHAASAPTKTSATEIATPASMKCVDLGRYEEKGSAVIDTAAGKVWQRTVDQPLRTAVRDAVRAAVNGWRL